MTKKQANKIASLINACTVWNMAVRDELKKDEPNNKEVRAFMEYHDKYAKELNEILGTIAVHVYTPETV
jgi:hypothetical protein